MPFTFERMTDFLKVKSLSLPSAEIFIIAEKVSLFSLGLSEQIPFESSFGSIGMTLSA